jgi:NAD(P)-dependent dehydrogenase (short-subunit alcohol dehydrogenase family)
MAAHNSYNNVPYPAIDAKNFVGAHKGKVVFITGAGRGVGQGISVAFAKSGATLALVDFNKDTLEGTVKQCRDLGVEVLPLQADVTNFAQVDAAIAEYAPRRASQLVWGNC